MGGGKLHGATVNTQEIDEASWVAARGATVGAAKWALFSVLAGGVAYAYSPLFRGLTIPGKAFLFMSGTTFGSIIEADRRLRHHEVQVRRQKSMKRDAEVWQRYQNDYAEQAASAKLQESAPKKSA